MKVRLNQLKNRGDQIRTYGYSVSETLQVYAGAITGLVMCDRNAAESTERLTAEDVHTLEKTALPSLAMKREPCPTFCK